MCTVMSAADSDHLTSFPMWIPVLSFSSLIAIASTSKTVLNKSGKSGHPCRHSCLVPDLECFQLFITEYDVGCRFVIYIWSLLC